MSVEIKIDPGQVAEACEARAHLLAIAGDHESAGLMLRAAGVLRLKFERDKPPSGEAAPLATANVPPGSKVASSR